MLNLIEKFIKKHKRRLSLLNLINFIKNKKDKIKFK